MHACARVIVALAVAVGLVAATGGCVSGEGNPPPEWLPGGPAQQQAPDPDAPPTPEGAHGHGTEVFMMGRSVMSGWFESWGYDHTSPVLRDGFALYYHEVPGPPDIGTEAAAAVADLPPGTIVFFKLCFVDFSPGNAEENLGYVRQVLDACEARGLTLVVGNALPQVRGASTPELADTHLAYNAGLEQMAAGSDTMAVFDLYSLLAGQDGTLPVGLAVSPDDSHLNHVAYSVLDEAFFEFLAGLQP